MICSAGLEFRDYPTLISAVDGLDMDLEIAAASPWSQRRNLADQTTLPPNVRVGKRSYDQLRELYDRSRFVVVPLFDVDFQAGSLVMYEAMAMGKAVIATRTRAHRDGDILQENVTGVFVPPGDAGALRQAILRLHRDPAEADRLGANARRIVEQGLNHDAYVSRMVEIARSVGEPTAAPDDQYRPTLAAAAY
jgi:glycosyltransferase involved in cell wall biosynthesis